MGTETRSEENGMYRYLRFGGKKRFLTPDLDEGVGRRVGSEERRKKTAEI